MVVDIADHTCPCCGKALHRIGEDSGERLDIVPAQFRVLIVRRPKYAFRACENVVVRAPAPARLIEGGLPTEATVAQVLVSKYADHLPLYRQAQIYARQGIELDRSTLADWVGRAAFLLRPVHQRLLTALECSAKLFADETTAPVLDPGRGRTKIGQLWAYARDDRPWGGTDPPGVAYVYAPDRKAERPITHLAGFKGTLQVDGYGGYRVLAERGEVQLAFCWSHVRRRFYELAAAGPAPIASEALERIAGLYAIEKEIRDRSADERRAVRQTKSRLIVNDLEPWLRAKLTLISQKTKLAEAIRYALSRWDGLTRFLDDGRIEINSNVMERSIRPIVLNRKNAIPTAASMNSCLGPTLPSNHSKTWPENSAYASSEIYVIAERRAERTPAGIEPELTRPSRYPPVGITIPARYPTCRHTIATTALNPMVNGISARTTPAPITQSSTPKLAGARITTLNRSPIKIPTGSTKIEDINMTSYLAYTRFDAQPVNFQIILSCKT